MSYTPTLWQDHVLSENTYNLKQNAGGTYTITPSGKVIRQGTPMSADNFNHMEQGIKEASNNADEALEELKDKASKDHTHNYAGSTSAGGAASSANKLNTNSGSATQPVYFADGVPKACTYTLGKSVPSNAVFTDTTYSAMTAATASTAGAAGLVPAPEAGKQASFLRGDGTWAVPTDTKYSVATQTSNGLMSSADKHKLDLMGMGTLLYSGTVGGESSVEITITNISLYDAVLMQFKSNFAINSYFNTVVPLAYIDKGNSFDVCANIPRRTAGQGGTSTSAYDVIITISKSEKANTIKVEAPSNLLISALGTINIYTL